MFLEKLQENESMKQSIREAASKDAYLRRMRRFNVLMPSNC